MPSEVRSVNRLPEVYRAAERIVLPYGRRYTSDTRVTVEAVVRWVDSAFTKYATIVVALYRMECGRLNVQVGNTDEGACGAAIAHAAAIELENAIRNVVHLFHKTVCMTVVSSRYANDRIIHGYQSLFDGVLVLDTATGSEPMYHNHWKNIDKQREYERRRK